MAVTFDTSRYIRRYAAFRAYTHLTSPWLVLGLVVSTVLATLAWIAVALLSLEVTLVGVALLLTSLSAGLSLIFIFASTYFPYLPQEKQLAVVGKASEDKSINVATVAEFNLLGTLGSYTRPAATTTLSAAVAAVLQTTPARAFLARLQLPTAATLQALQEVVMPSLSWPMFSAGMLNVAHELSAPQVMIEHAIATLLLQRPLQPFLRSHDLETSDIVFVTHWLTSLRLSRAAHKRWWDPANLLRFTGLGLSWTSGFTPFVDQFSHFPRGNLWDQIIVGREQYVDQLLTTLARQRQSNVLLVGQPGVGRLGVVKEMARRVRASTAHPALNGQRVVYIHIGEILAQGTSSAMQLAIVSRVLAELEHAGNVIAVIDGLGSILAEEGEVRLNLTEVLLPFFSSLAVRVVVIISSEEYHLRLKTNEELIHFFEVINMEAISAAAALQVLAFATPLLEKETGLTLPYKTLRAITEGTEAILPHIPFPERAFDILEEVVVVVQAQKAQIIEPQHIDTLISRKVGVPIGEIRATERQHLLSLESLMHQRVVNQQRAVATVARAMIRARAGVRSKERPIGSFLFLGPTGVGKTETAKTLAAAYFGSEDYLLRLDMSEFQTENSIENLLGGSRHNVGRLTSLISDRPFSVLLLDEFEKAHQSIQQLFLQVFDEGRLTDARGQTVSFKHAIIIATSNAGAELIRRAVKAGPLPENFDEQLREHILQQQIFRPELLNRFDGVVTFTPLSPDHLREIAMRMLRKLNKRLDAEHGLTVNVTAELVDYLLEQGYDPEFGARPMARAIQDSIEYAVAQKIIEGTTRPGQKLSLSPAVLRATRIP
ncbi:MAG: AAA family ATPase [Candidatus Andersenbacteria bacterium]